MAASSWRLWGENLFPHLPQLLEATAFLDSLRLPQIPLLPPSYKDPCDYSGPLQIIPGSPLHFQVLNPFCKVPFAKSVTFTGSRDGDKDICRGHYSASHRGRQTPPPALPWCPCPLPTLSFFNWNWSSGLHDLSSSYVWDRAEFKPDLVTPYFLSGTPVASPW